MREHNQYDVSIDLETSKFPTLVKDLQVPQEAVKRVAECIKGDVETHMIENITHLLRKWEGDIDALSIIKMYLQQAKQSIDEEVLNILQQWLEKHYKGEGTW